jgi:GT2 family glycosyltransferase
MEGNPKIGVLGGMSTAYFTTTPPSWFDKVKDGYAIGKQFTRQGDITEERGYIWGAGMVMPTLLIRNIFNSVFTSSDRQGAILASGGDTEICYKAIAAGYRLYYDERLQYRHYITEDRMNWNYKVRLAEGQTKSLVNLLYLRKRILNNITETKQVVLKDFSYLIFHNIKWKYLVRLRKILNIRKHEGDVDLLHAYLDLYFVYCFFQIKILGKN